MIIEKMRLFWSWQVGSSSRTPVWNVPQVSGSLVSCLRLRLQRFTESVKLRWNDSFIRVVMLKKILLTMLGSLIGYQVSHDSTVTQFDPPDDLNAS